MIYLTFDQDWAPEWATRDLVTSIEQAGLKATFFATHSCSSLALMQASENFELGWHPNFLPGSSHGADINEVLSSMAAIAPKAKGVRAHYLISGTPYLTAYRARGLSYESSDLHDGQRDLEPFLSWTGMVQLPIFFEDDVHLGRGLPCSLETIELDPPGLKIFSFHPVLLALNINDLGKYQALKESLASQGKSLNQGTREDFEPFVERSVPGMRDLFDTLLGLLNEMPMRAGGTLEELVRVFLAGRST